MASADLRAELKCPICLEIFTDPVNLPCGHNYCRACIHRMLDTQAGAHACPQCRTAFLSRPALQKNITLCNIVAIFSSANPEPTGPAINCSHCLYSAVPAVRSCLHCEASLCPNHLNVHSKSAEHVLTEATGTPERWKCPLHKEILKYRCAADGACVCVSCCLVGEHRGHQVELLVDAAEKKKETLRILLRRLTSRRDQIQKKIQDLEEGGAGEPGGEEPTVRCPGVRGEEVVYTVSSLLQILQIKKEKVSKRIRQIQGVCDSSDPVTVLQKSEDLHGEQEGGDQELHGEGGDQELHGEEGGGQELHGEEGGGQELHEGHRANRRILGTQDLLELVLDIHTAANNILVSDDLKTMYWSAVYQNRPETPQRFQYNQIFSRQVFSSGCHYWEVETSETGDWRLGVAYGRMEKKGDHSYLGDNAQSWCLRRLYKNQYSVMHDNMVTTCPHTFSCNQFRIFLDYEAGQLSFFELSSPVRHLHTVAATFTEPLHAAFGIGYWLSGEHCCLKILHQESLP